VIQRLGAIVLADGIRQAPVGLGARRGSGHQPHTRLFEEILSQTDVVVDIVEGFDSAAHIREGEERPWSFRQRTPLPQFRRSST